MIDVEKLKRTIRIKQEEADDLALFMGDTAAADIHTAKAQAYASVLRCIENLEAQENHNGQLATPS